MHSFSNCWWMARGLHMHSSLKCWWMARALHMHSSLKWGWTARGLISSVASAVQGDSKSDRDKFSEWTHFLEVWVWAVWLRRLGSHSRTKFGTSSCVLVLWVRCGGWFVCVCMCFFFSVSFLSGRIFWNFGCGLCGFCVLALTAGLSLARVLVFWCFGCVAVGACVCVWICFLSFEFLFIWVTTFLNVCVFLLCISTI